MHNFRFSVVIEKDEDGYTAFCPELQGCYAQGETYEEVLDNIRDAIRLHLDDRIEAGEKIPQAQLINLTTVDVTVWVINSRGFLQTGSLPFFKKKGFTCVRQSGSHKIFKNNAGIRVTVPDHAGKILHPKIVKQICKDANINPDELVWDQESSLHLLTTLVLYLTRSLITHVADPGQPVANPINGE